MTSMNIDMMLEKAGDFGRYQIYLMVLFSVVNIVSAFHYFSQTFISVTPEHWCNSTKYSNVEIFNETVFDEIRKYVEPLKDKSCTTFRQPEIRNNSVWSTVKCDTGWIYDRDNGFDSIVTELNWVCDEDWKPVIGQSTFFIGSVLGTLVLGVLSDRIGRLPVLCIANALALIGNISTIFAVSLPSFASCRFFSGLATDSNFVMMYIIVMEYVRPSMRTIGLNLCIGVFYCVGCVAVPLVAVALGTWRKFLLVTSLPIALVVCFYFVLVLFAALLAAPALCQHNYYQSGGHQQANSHYHHEPEHYDDHPKYEYHYKVEDEHTGDYKEQHETRDGDVVKGFYWLLDADGHRRHVEYSVEGKSGFVAKVTREPTGHAPVPPRAPVHHAPVHQAPVHHAPVHYAPAPAKILIQAPAHSGHHY